LVSVYGGGAGMNFVFRPTPIVVLSGKTVGTDHAPMRRLPAGVMHGYARGMASPRLNAMGRRTINGVPWIVRSGAMGTYMPDPQGWRHLIAGMGDNGDDDDLTIDTTSAPILDTLQMPAFNDPIILSPSGSDLNLEPTTSPTGSTLINTPIPSVSANTQDIANLSTMVQTQGAASAAATLQAQTAAASAAASAPSLLQSFINAITGKSTTTQMTAAQPGVYSSLTATPSWFSQATLVSGMSNGTVQMIGVAALIGLSVVAGKK